MVPLQEVACILIALLAVLLFIVKLFQDKINRRIAEQLQRIIRLNGTGTSKWDNQERGSNLECIPENTQQVP